MKKIINTITSGTINERLRAYFKNLPSIIIY